MTVRKWGYCGVLIVFVLVISWIFSDAPLWLLEHWSKERNYAHGPLIVAVAIALAWWQLHTNRQIIRKTDPGIWSQVVMPASLLVALLGKISGATILTCFAIPFVLLGAIDLFGGRALARTLCFPVLYLLTVIPLGSLLSKDAVYPLQWLAASLSSATLSLAGISAERSGLIIHADGFSFTVAEGCSGLRTMIVLLQVALLGAFLIKPLSYSSRIWICVLTIPVAILANSLRISVIGFIGAHFGKSAAIGSAHDLVAKCAFALAFALLLIVITLVSRYDVFRRSEA